MDEVEKYDACVSQLVRHLDAFLAFRDVPSCPPDDELMVARWAIARSVGELASFYEKFVRAPLEATGDPALMAQANQIDEAMNESMQRLVAHALQWSAQAIRDDWIGYCSEFPRVHQALRINVAKRTVIMPSLLRLLNGASATPRRNWIRDIWAVQDSFNDK